MNAVLLSKIQFAITAGFHFLFPPLTIGMSWIIFAMLTMYLLKNEDVYLQMSRFWIKLFAISFAIGVATGIVMEFQFGTNWSEYSRFVGDIFGAPLAAEGVFAFFLESVFVGVLIWGKERVSDKMYWFSSLMVAVGSTLSAFWIIVANSWMQTPAGYEIVSGKAHLTDFMAAVFNPSTLPRYLHTLDAALITGSFFIMGISAYLLLKNKELPIAKNSLRVAMFIGAFAALLQLPLGHYHAAEVAKTQPLKLAAFEGLFETKQGAPLTLFGIPDATSGTTKFSIEIPKFLSFLAYGDFNAEVKGLNEFKQSDWPPLMITFQTYHLMIALGMFFILLTLTGVYLAFKNKLLTNRGFLRILFYTIPLPFLTNELGWIAAEVGRQPWIVYNVLRTAQGVSIVVPASQIMISILIFTLIYIILLAAWIFLINKKLNVADEKAQYEEVKGEAITWI